MRGYRVAQVSVTHYPRRAGKTKYGTWGRLKKGLADVWAVRWMKKNRIDYAGLVEVVEAPEGARPAGRTAARAGV
jgi:dolichol-phosphate mannosyltransferase